MKTDFGGAGSTHVNFNSPPGHIGGFRDYLNYLAAPTGASSSAGPISAVGNYGGLSEPTFDDDDVEIAFIRLTDDLHEDGIPGKIVIVNPDNGLLTTLTDFDDLHTFNIAFDRVSVHQYRGFRSFDIGAVFWLYDEGEATPDDNQRAAWEVANVIEADLRPIDANPTSANQRAAVAAPSRLPVIPLFTRFAPNRRKSGIGIVYGYREVAAWDDFGFQADGGILGTTSSETSAENWVVGPQLGVVGFKRFGRLSLYAHGLVVAGINDGEVSQVNAIGQDLIPGATNRLLYSQPTRSTHNQYYDELMPMGVIWLEAGMQLTTNSSLKIAWSAMLVDNVLLAENRTRYFLPDMGLLDPGMQRLQMQNVFCGIELVR